MTYFSLLLSMSGVTGVTDLGATEQIKHIMINKLLYGVV